FSPSILEASGEAPPTLGDLSPAWVVPLVLLLGAVFVAAAVWRGRRLGPLVVEPLPVAVRADETMRGRARLYARAGARLRAVDALRLGALDRIAPLLGLPSSADAEQVAVSAAALTGRPVGGLRALLRDAVPASDGDLVRLANDLAELETAVRRATGRH
ncbi:MAG: DUF4350 domain-containing protein, partial [Microbacteriaceae bacterium]|nr:DUF4350 domain-containing protein [Microbacteriaceae bacterium]